MFEKKYDKIIYYAPKFRSEFIYFPVSRFYTPPVEQA